MQIHTASSARLPSRRRSKFLGAMLPAVSLIGTLGLAACGPDYDPLTRQGMWEPGHTNHNNLTLMVANPADLVRGTGRTTADGQLAAAAIDRLRTDKVKKLPDSDIAQLTTSGSTGGAQ